MAARTALDALSLRPSRFLVSAWPWRSLAYLASGVLLGLVTLATLVALAAFSVLLAVVVVGWLGLVAIPLTGIYVARFERWRLRLVDLDPAPDPHRPAERPGRWHWLRNRLREHATWREFGYVIVSLMALWWIDALVIGLAPYIPVGLVAGPAFSPDVPLEFAIPSAVFGLILAPVAAYPVTAWAGARAAMTRAILAPRDAELGDQLVEVTRSRARLVDAFELERRRIERDLHDGAQQRLVALTMKLGLARLDAPAGSPIAGQLDEAHDLAKTALAELRELIQGVHPKVLTDRGLPAAVSDVAGRSSVTVDVDLALPGRLPPPVEVTAYFVVVEALTNVARHSRASRARVYGRLQGDRLALEVRDDGVGGADPEAGSGLAGLADRVAAVRGTLVLSSPAGGPTTLRMEIPCTASER